MRLEDEPPDAIRGEEALGEEPARPREETPLNRISGRDARLYAEAWSAALAARDPRIGPNAFDLDDDIGRQLFNLTVKFATLAHSEANSPLDLETFALRYRPATYAETLRKLAEDIRRERARGSH